MKVEFYSNEHGVDIELTPETIAEVSQLALFSLNASAQKPSVFMTIGSDVPECWISLRKFKPSVQKKSISSKL